MAVVSDTLVERWRSGDHVGEAQPKGVVLLRRGRFRRTYSAWAGDDLNAKIPEETDQHAWYATWGGFGPDDSFEDWTVVPNVSQIELNQNFDDNGIQSLTLTIENVVLAEHTNPMLGLWHSIERGYLAPWKGYTPVGRPQEFPKVPAWYSLLARNVQIMVLQGYGDDTLTPTYTGLIDDTDLTSKPDQIVITARDFGQTLVDERLFGYNKSPQVKDPVIFADALSADDRQSVGTSGSGDASSTRPGHPESFASDDSSSTSWESGAHPDPNVTEWLECRLPEGRYVDFLLDPLWQGMECYVGIYARPRRHGPSRIDGTPIGEGWVQEDEGAIGRVPGDNGGWAYVKHIGSTAQARTYLLGASYDLGDNSILRVGFRKLHADGNGAFRAGVKRLKAVKRTLSQEAKTSKWILVNDVSDVVKVVLRWAGFKEWNIEDTGVRLGDNLVTNRGNFYMDVIKQLTDLTGFVFYIDDPPDQDSIGVPTFRQSSALRDTNAPDANGIPKAIAQVRDKDLLTAISVKLTDEPLSYIIRVRGQEIPQDQGGVMLGTDPVRRITAEYRPPWTTNERMAGLIKHTIVTVPKLKT